MDAAADELGVACDGRMLNRFGTRGEHSSWPMFSCVVNERNNRVGFCSVEDRRTSARRRVLWGGVIASAPGTRVIPCVIRSISASGAQVRVSSDEPIPDDLFLLDEKNRKGHTARIVWRRSALAGLEFQRSFSIDGALPQPLRFLRGVLANARLHRDRSPRQSQPSWLVVLAVADLAHVRSS